jgi:hypothetical protein
MQPLRSFAETAMTSTPISAWHDEPFELKSPNGAHTAKLSELSEYGMGSPTTGRLEVAGYKIDSANPSVVWSTDSRFIAFPLFNDARIFRIMVIDVDAHRTRLAPGEWLVLELVSFDGKLLRAISSPIHEPENIEIDVSTLNWDSQ